MKPAYTFRPASASSTRPQALVIRVAALALTGAMLFLGEVGASAKLSRAPQKPAVQKLATQTKPTPHAVINDTVRDCGDVFSGEEVEQAFSVTNRGDAPLELAEKRLIQTASHGGPLSVATVAAAYHPAPT